MSAVFACIAQSHDHRLVALAVLVCLIGSATTAQLFARLMAARGRLKTGWLALTSVSTGTMVWCTHFVAMMAFDAGVPVMLDPKLTMVSLAVAIGASVPGLTLASMRDRRLAWAGGALVGGAIAAMHYTGMAAYRIDGIVEWHPSYVTASVVLAVVLSAPAFGLMRSPKRSVVVAGSGLLGLAVAALHFTGMTAISIRMLRLHAGSGLSELGMEGLAMATACAGLLFVGCAAISALMDGQTQSEAYQRMRRMALHDGLTDLPNRLCFGREMAARLGRTRGLPRMAVVMLDLSRFKSVNDTYGHQAGDQLLVALASRMAAIVRPDECIARLGGDEFAGLISYRDRGELDDFLARLSGLFAEPFVFERFSATIGANIGVALAPQDGSDADTLLARADLAMYRAKNEHSPVPCFYTASMDEAVRDKRDLVTALRKAVAEGAFQLHYQVQASLPDGEICGYEVLVRWHHPARGTIPPCDFIPLAEEIGEIVPLSRWILRQACFEAALWPNRHVIAVNLSPLHLSDPTLVETVSDALAASGLPPARLALELTESAIIRDRDHALQQLHTLKAMGVNVALDDFGVGYSSLDVLRSFSFNKIKLDASFVAAIEHDEQAVAILRSVTSLGSSLAIPVLAEGIETPAQLRIAMREGCAAIQGYLIGRPSRTLADPVAVRSIIAAADAPPAAWTAARVA